jgi:hypothetical protein
VLGYDRCAGGRARRVPGHGREVGPALEDPHPQRRGRGGPDGGRARLVVEERELAEAVAGLERADDASAADDFSPA